MSYLSPLAESSHRYGLSKPMRVEERFTKGKGSYEQVVSCRVERLDQHLVRGIGNCTWALEIVALREIENCGSRRACRCLHGVCVRGRSRRGRSGAR
ncbi:hypothetical protein Bamb_3153 [Burkholderia ambifaria AMMD]|uniref:Uncharacterized protein n=1 Tax=Burkholderia ambifaria (strain ATCC BAA-244 / DSM 16087 / CCUG 44356 / LMG 19182 / AMMD) TaxID=339670 RepID=Q0BAW4_BURCM|nr:hypothetical protein Bamb_3153 [Burkholderia ambifaria AMMD]